MKRPYGRHSRWPWDPPFSPGDAILAAGRGIQRIGQRSVYLDLLTARSSAVGHAATVVREKVTS
jgi:hypothetical protein